MVGGGGSGRGFCSQSYLGGAYNNSMLEQIMDRFRPIAPKPSGSVSGVANDDARHIKQVRVKRKYVRQNNNINKKKDVETVTEDKNCGSDEEVVTLSLLAETPDPKETPQRTAPTESDQILGRKLVPIPCPSYSGSDLTVGSWFIVECVTDVSVDVKGLGSTDVERRVNLGRDKCPGFISDGYNRVRWTNEAYRRMVGHFSNGENGWPEMVWLIMKERLPLIYPAFACRVRVEYMNKKERKMMVVPCDVWRLDGGDLAWRLDVQAALSLGR